MPLMGQFIPQRPKSPCKDCAKRCMGCHSTCTDGLQFEADMKAYRDALNKQRDFELVSYGLLRDNATKKLRQKANS